MSIEHIQWKQFDERRTRNQPLHVGEEQNLIGGNGRRKLLAPVVRSILDDPAGTPRRSTTSPSNEE